MKKIWCLFSIENQYDQPLNNLKGWWTDKPTAIQCREVVSQSNAKANAVDFIEVVKGKEVRVGNYDYRLEQVSESTKDEQ